MDGWQLLMCAAVGCSSHNRNVQWSRVWRPWCDVCYGLRHWVWSCTWCWDCSQEVSSWWKSQVESQCKLRLWIWRLSDVQYTSRCRTCIWSQHAIFCSGNFDFYPRDAMLERVIVIATCLSVRPSVRLSVCHAPVLCQNEESLASWFLHRLVASRL